jgi:hypothetical protein
VGTYGAFIGTALRGPTVPTLITSWSDYNTMFGGFSSGKTLPMALHQFFTNGGGAAYVCRVISVDGASPDTGGAYAASVSYGTRTSDGPPPVYDDRLLFDAVTPGAWGNLVSVDVTVNAPVMVYPPGGGAAVEDEARRTFSVEVREYVRGAWVVMERFRDLSMVETNSKYVAAAINSSTVGSRYLRVTDLKKDNSPLTYSTPDPLQLANGTDGVNPILSVQYETAFALFDEIEAMLVVNVPGVPDVAGVGAKVKERGDSVLVLDTAENVPPNDPSLGGPYTSSYEAIYYPWIHIVDPTPGAPRGSTTKIAPGASVTGMIIRTDRQRGVFKAPAGTSAVISGAVANELRLSNAELDQLASLNINVIRPVAGIGIAAMGARTRSQDTAQYLSVRRTLNYVKSRSVKASRFALFEPNTPSLWEQLRVVNGAYLNELWSNGGLAGRSPSEAYYVKCDEDNNTPQTIMNGELHIEIGVSPAFPAEFIIIRVAQFEADATITASEE